MEGAVGLLVVLGGEPARSVVERDPVCGTIV